MIDYEYKDLFLQSSISKDLIITDGTVTVNDGRYFITNHTVIIDNTILDSEAFSLSQILSSGEQIHFGEANASSISFTMHENITGLRGKWLNVYMYLEKNPNTMLRLGRYKVDEDTLSADRTVRNVVAYDALYDVLNADVRDWYNEVLPRTTSEVTLLAFRSSFMAHFGIEVESTTLVNDNAIIRRTIDSEALTGATVLQAICEMNGCFGMMTNEGKFRYVVLDENIDSGLFPSEILFPNDKLYPSDPNPNTTEIPKAIYTDIQWEDWMSEGITRLVIRQNSEDVGTTIGDDATNTYIITGNFLLYGKDATQLREIGSGILANIKNRYFKPATVNCIGNPCHELGDPIRIRTIYRGIVTYILGRTLTGIQALKDCYTADGQEYYKEEVNSIMTQFKQLAGKTASLKVDTDGIEARVESIEDGTASVITQLDNQISLKVSKDSIVDDLDAQMSGIDITANQIKVASTGSFVVDAENMKLDSKGNMELINNNDATKGNFIQQSADGQVKTVISSGRIVCSIQPTGAAIVNQVIISPSNNGAIYFGDGSMRNFISGAGGKINGYDIITDYEMSAREYIQSGSTSGVEVLAGQGLALNAPNYNGWVHVGYQSSAVSIGSSSTTLRMLGHELSFKEVKDVNGNTVHVLGY